MQQPAAEQGGGRREALQQLLGDRQRLDHNLRQVRPACTAASPVLAVPQLDLKHAEVTQMGPAVHRGADSSCFLRKCFCEWQGASGT